VSSIVKESENTKGVIRKISNTMAKRKKTNKRQQNTTQETVLKNFHL
jgi:hypothetical protein